MNKLYLILIVLIISGCGNGDDDFICWYNKEIMAREFTVCMNLLPKEPEESAFNGRDEMIYQCRGHAEKTSRVCGANREHREYMNKFK